MILPFEEIPKNSNILIAGAGGGFDFLCGLPVGLELMKRGNKVSFASYSSSNLSRVKNAGWLTETILEVTPDSYMEECGYFPELFFTKWFKEKKNKDMPVYCFPRSGIKSLHRAYDFLADYLSLSELYVIDGGVDGIFTGTEYDLGTPSIDSISIIAASLLEIKKKYFVMTAFGTEGYNKTVSHTDVLERVSDLIAKDKFLGVSSLLKNDKTGEDFIEGANYIFNHMAPEARSTIVSSIINAMKGSFGDREVNLKTRNSPVWLSPLTTFYWFFELPAVAKMKIFYEEVLNTDSVSDVSEIIHKLHSSYDNKKRRNIPV